MRSDWVRFVAGVLTLMVLRGRAAADPADGSAAIRPASGAPVNTDLPLPVALDIQAPATCATRDELMARVLARTSRVRFTGRREATTVLRVSVQPISGGLVLGELVAVSAGGLPTMRRLTGKSCAEAVDALALVIAIAVDPLSEPPAAPDARAEPPTSQASPFEVRPREPAPESPGLEPKLGGIRPRAASPATPSSRPSLGRAGYAVGLTGGALFGPAPRALPALGAFVSAAVDRASPWSPAFALSVRHGVEGGIVEPGGTAGFSLDVLDLDLCPVRVAASVMQVRPCLVGLGGRLSAQGSSTYSPRAYTRPFAALGASVLADATLGRHVAVVARVGAGASLIRDRCAFSPEVFHRVASVTLDVAAGVALRFP